MAHFSKMIALRTLMKSERAVWRSLDTAALRNSQILLLDGLSYGRTTKGTVRTRTRKSSLTTKTYHLRKPASDDGAAVSSEQKKTVPITFMEERPDGSIEREVEVQAVVGDHLLDAAHANNVELEGACGGELACSTCHLVFEPEIYDKLPTKSEEEDDMLDLAFSVTDTSRLGCQIHVKEEYAGMKLRIPNDGFSSADK